MADQDLLDQFVAKKAEDDRLTKQEMTAINKQAEKLTDVNLNMSFARMAVGFVRQKLKLVAANWDEPLDTSSEGVFRVEIEKMNSQTPRDFAALRSQAQRDLDAAASQPAKDQVRASFLNAMRRLEATQPAGLQRAKAKSEAAWDRTDQRLYGGLRKNLAWRRIKRKPAGE